MHILECEPDCDSISIYRDTLMLRKLRLVLVLQCKHDGAPGRVLRTEGEEVQDRRLGHEHSGDCRGLPEDPFDSE